MFERLGTLTSGTIAAPLTGLLLDLQAALVGLTWFVSDVFVTHAVA